MFAVYKNMNVRCNFNMHNIYIYIYKKTAYVCIYLLLKPNIKGFIEGTNL